MRAFHNVVLRFPALGIPRQPTLLTQLGEIFSAGQNFVDVRLVARIPNHRIGRGIKDPVQSDGQLHYSEVWPQMSAGLGHVLHQKLADVPGQLDELSLAQPLEVLGGIHGIKN